MKKYIILKSHLYNQLWNILQFQISICFYQLPTNQALLKNFLKELKESRMFYMKDCFIARLNYR